MNKTVFISQLSKKVQLSIKNELKKSDLSKKDVEDAMNSRLCDLEDTIDISKYIN